jgi:uncharacterized protein (TIGR02117 family)
MRTRFLALLLALAALVFGGCASMPKLSERLNPPRTEKVWLVSNGWHTSVALRTKDAPAELRTLDSRAKYFVIGWGGKEFYTSKTISFRTALSVFLPSASALHVIPVRTSLLIGCPRSEIIEFDVSKRGLARLDRRLHAAFARDKKGQALVISEGRVPRSRFFLGSETYYLPKTCNLWAAASLDAAGVRIMTSTAIVADNLIWQGRKRGRLLSIYRFPRDIL